MSVIDLILVCKRYQFKCWLLWA